MCIAYGLFGLFLFMDMDFWAVAFILHLSG